MFDMRTTQTHPFGDRHFAYGACVGCVSLTDFAALLGHLGLSVHQGRYSILVEDCECFSFEFDQDTENGASIEGTASSGSVLRANVRRVHDALVKAGVRHWIGITDAIQNPVESLSYAWPEVSASASD